MFGLRGVPAGALGPRCYRGILARPMASALGEGQMPIRGWGEEEAGSMGERRRRGAGERGSGGMRRKGESDVRK